ncbi:MAG: uracil-DNA glycosylase [Candidatus Bipolaricaulota bacterium]
MSSAFELSLDVLASRVADCRRCALAAGRRMVVFGEGNPRAPLLFVGEGPGEVEDETGRPFVGPAGQLLTQILASVGIPREDVYIANVVKCRPPENRVPTRQEMDVCWDWLAAQIAFIRPRIVVTLGNSPTQWFLGSSDGITQLRGRFHRWRGGIEVFPMYHPSYLLRNASKAKGSPKHQTWLDIQTVKERISFLLSPTRAS